MGSRKLYHVAMQALLEKLWERDGRKCGLCSEALPGIKGTHIEHIQPTSLGGSDDLDNLQIAHYHCNILKGNGLSWQDRHPRVEVICAHCGDTFIGLRGVSRYCTPAHQNAAAARRHRERRRRPSPGGTETEQS